jgi:hypothetical protein
VTERHPAHTVLGRFRLDGAPLRGDPQRLAAWWRGAVASLFHAETAFHGHDGDRTVPRYPEVHYRWIDNAPALFAFGPAAQLAMAHPWPGAAVRIGDQERRIVEVEWRTTPIEHSFSRRLVRYDLGAPWIALNQDNHARYRALGPAARRAELDRILVGNLLSMSKGLGWRHAEHEIVYAAFEPAREVSCQVKDVALAGFEGSFVSNLVLPDGLAVGRSVSLGFGWFRRAEPPRATGGP